MLLQNYRECSVNNFPSHGTVARSNVDRSIFRYVPRTGVYVARTGVALVMMLCLFILFVPGQVLQSFVNPYKVLQISEDADPKAIKRAYRKLALRCSVLRTVSVSDRHVFDKIAAVGTIQTSVKSHQQSRTFSGFKKLMRF